VVERDELTREYDLCIVMESPDKNDSQSGSIGNGGSFHTYLVKCMPPKRKPTVQEIKSCMGYLHKEIQAIKPKVIMPLGATSLRMFNLHNKGGLNSIRGQAFKLPLPTQDQEVLYDIVPSYDPAFFNYSPDPLLERRVRHTS
jgi:DNA polymerase